MRQRLNRVGQIIVCGAVLVGVGVKAQPATCAEAEDSTAAEVCRLFRDRPPASRQDLLAAVEQAFALVVGDNETLGDGSSGDACREQIRQALVSGYRGSPEPTAPADRGGDVDPGITGGHFDTDVYRTDGKSWKRVQHKHAYDDAHDVTYVDLLAGFDKITLADNGVPDGTPLRIKVRNTHNAAGTYTIAADTMHTGQLHDAVIEVTVPSLSSLRELRLDFRDLATMRATQPGVVDHDSLPLAEPNRDGALTVDVYANDVIVYEFSAYWHVK